MEDRMSEQATIHQAIAAAIGEVRKVGKTDRNKFDGYDFASIDKFLEMVNPICATHGLFPFITQQAVEFYENTNSKGGKSVWARFTFQISLHHSSGGQFGPAVMMVAVPMTGAQSSGSAQSYALKQFFRGVFMIPTGDKDDADLNPNEAHQKAPPATKPAAPQYINADQFIALRDLVEGSGADEAKFLAAYGAQSLEQFPAERFDHAIAALNKKIEKERNADLGGDSIPHQGE
jgi:hypothetical protein